MEEERLQWRKVLEADAASSLETSRFYCMMKPGDGAKRGGALWGRAGGYWDR